MKTKFIICLCMLTYMTVSTAKEAKQEDKRPNVIFLLADDMRYDSLGFLEKFELKTPNLDKLAARGIRFTKSYNTTAICMASRAQIMTGKYEFATGCNFDHGDLDHRQWTQSYPYLLRKAGYYTGFAGKFGFHVKRADGGKGKAEVAREAFDWWGGWMGQGSYQVQENKEATAWFSAHGEKQEHTTHALGTMGQDFLVEAQKSGKPFCLSISFKAPHTPYAIDPRYKDVYADSTFAKPGNYGEPGAANLPPQPKSGRPFAKGKSWLKDYNGTMAKYHTMIYGMDQAIGMITEKLKALDLADNTIIIFTSDNGHFNGSKAMGGKIFAYEEGSLAPTILVDPRQQTPSKYTTRNALTANIDIAPTILDLADVAAPATMHGKSLLPLVNGTKSSLRESLLLINVWGTPSAQSIGVVTKDHKYLHWFYGAGDFTRTEELFNLQKDPLENKNLAHSPEQSAALESMRAHYDRWMVQWKKQSITGHGYEKYSRLANRALPFSGQSADEVVAMSPPEKVKKTTKTKKQKK